MKRLISTLVVGLAMSSGAMAAGKAPYTAMYVFGDSYSDMGARLLDGNGPTVPMYLAESMGIALTHSKDPMPGNKSLNFAATAGTTGRDEGTGKWCCIGMQDQVDDFAARVRSGKLKFDPEKTLFLLEGGLNDSDIPTETTVANLTAEIKALRALGARHFSLSLLPTKVEDFAKEGARLNPAYQDLVKNLKKQGVNISLNNWGTYLDEIVDNPAEYGIANTKDKCAGRALFKEDPTPCAKPETYFFHFSGHPSTKVNKIVADKLYKDLSKPMM